MSRWHTIQGKTFRIDDITHVEVKAPYAGASCRDLILSFASKNQHGALVHIEAMYPFSGARALTEAEDARDALIAAIDKWEQSQRALQAAPRTYNPTIIYATGTRKRKRRGSF